MSNLKLIESALVSLGYCETSFTVQKLQQEALAAVREMMAQEVIGYATHHEPPMLFPDRDEAALHCDDDEEPIGLVALKARLGEP